MNKVTKERVAEKVTKAISDERLLLREAGAYLGVKSTNLSMIKKEIYYDYVSKATWDILHEWVDSGLTIRGWGLKKRRIEPDCMVPDIEPEKEIVLTLTPSDITESVLEAILKDTDLNKPGKGIAFVLSIDKIAGINHDYICK